jgi:predicted CoA-binding protein
MNQNNEQIKEILKSYKKICVIGMSADPQKPGHKVCLFMRSKGYDLVGVNPNEKEIAGFKCYKSFSDVPLEYRKFVDVFRKPEHVPSLVDEVLKVGGAEVLWLQMGIANAEAEKKAEVAGLKVVSDRCLHIEYERNF